LNQTISALPNPPWLYQGIEPLSFYVILYSEAQSYIYNEAILGWGEFPLTPNPTGRLEGKASLIHQASRTMFACDGLGGAIYSRPDVPAFTGVPFYTIYNAVDPITQNSISASVTLADAFNQATGGAAQPIAGDTANFDLLRHRGKINIAFCDGHVETRNITAADLSSVYLLAP
jgi:prepilin-type processing-associated H-X9-DG protein